MQSEIIYIPNIQILTVKKRGGYYEINLEGINRILTNLEPLGKPFSIITKNKSNKNVPLEETAEFREFHNLPTRLEYYLREAEIESTLSRRENNLPQHLGINYGNPATMEIIKDFEKRDLNIKRNIFPCQFYLIKDKI